jgi:hypothetical protein
MSLPPRPPAPPGYHCAFDNDWFRPWICDRCGASIVASAFETHEAWHQALVDAQVKVIRELARSAKGSL